MPIFTLPWEVHSTKHTRLTSGMDDSTIWDQLISRFYGHQETNDIETGGQDHCAKNVCNVTESSRVESSRGDLSMYAARRVNGRTPQAISVR